jgi:hypothetical protein
MRRFCVLALLWIAGCGRVSNAPPTASIPTNLERESESEDHDYWLDEAQHNLDQPTVQQRPFPVGENNTPFWETKQTEFQAADFIFQDREFRSETAELAPGAKRHLDEVALSLPHVDFLVVIEQSTADVKLDLDEARRQMIVKQLSRLGVENADQRVIVGAVPAKN